MQNQVKFNPQGVTDEFIKELQQHFSDAQICEIGYILMAYGGAHNFLSSIGEDVVDEEGNSLVGEDGMFGKDGFPLVFNTHRAQTVYQEPQHRSVAAPLPQTPFMTNAPTSASQPDRPTSHHTEVR